MTLVTASTFCDALTKLTAQEQKQAKIAAYDLANDPRGNGLSMHKVEAAPGFWTARVSKDLRMVLHKQGEHTLLAWVGHHDDAYNWATRKRLIPHERTGAMQFVEVVERIEERRVVSPGPRQSDDYTVPDPAPLPVHRPFAGLTDDQLLDVGVPRDWLVPVRSMEMASVEGLFDVLPAEAAEALTDFATGGKLEDHVAPVGAPGADPFSHPDAQRRFRVLDNLEELQAALDQPFEKWAVFLHPAQRALVERDWSGPARITGSAGTGKTIVALHRAAHIVRENAEARVLLTSFSKPLAAALQRKRDILTEAEQALRDRIEVRTLDQAAFELHTRQFGQPNLANPALVRSAIADARKAGLGGTHSAEFLFEEWEEVVDAWNVLDADAYASVPRIGRRTRLGPQQREAAWGVFAFVRERLAQRGAMTWAQVYARLEAWAGESGVLPFTHAVVDEAQDLSVAQVRLLGSLATGGSLFLAGDVGQRIFRLPFSWARLGLDIRGRSHSLKVNYRTSHQIRALADKLLPSSITDMDGVEEGRRGTVSVFDGPVPEIVLAKDEDGECQTVSGFIQDCLAHGIPAAEIGVLVRGEGQLARARGAVRAAGLDPRAADAAIIAAMHGAKGLEFRAVVVMACDEDVLPDPMRLASISDPVDLEAAYETERHLLYVACTRARDRLMVSGIAPGSDFLDDLKSRAGR